MPAESARRFRSPKPACCPDCSRTPAIRNTLICGNYQSSTLTFSQVASALRRARPEPLAIPRLYRFYPDFSMDTLMRSPLQCFSSHCLSPPDFRGGTDRRQLTQESMPPEGNLDDVRSACLSTAMVALVRSS